MHEISNNVVCVNRIYTQVIYQFALAQWSVQVNVLLNNCKRNITSLSLDGTIVVISHFSSIVELFVTVNRSLITFNINLLVISCFKFYVASCTYT